jgi:hypothetical protein
LYDSSELGFRVITQERNRRNTRGLPRVGTQVGALLECVFLPSDPTVRVGAQVEALLELL